MATVYYKRLKVTRIDANGVWIDVPSITLDVYNVTAAASLGTKSVDANGYLPEGSVTATAGDIIEFSHAGDPLTIRQVVTATQGEAYIHPDNNAATYIVENLLATTVDSRTADVYAQDLDNPDTLPFYLGTVKADATNYIPYQSSVEKNLRLYLTSKDDTGRLSAVDLAKDAEQVDLTVPALGSGGVESLFDHYTDETTSGTSEETLYEGLVEAGQLGVNGDKIEAFYSGDLGSNANSKTITAYFAGTAIGGIGTVQNGKPWLFDLELIRVSNSVVRAAIDMMASGDSPLASSAEISGLDLANKDYTMELRATTPSAAGDVTAKMGNAVFFPAATPLATNYLLSEAGEYLFSEGGSALAA